MKTLTALTLATVFAVNLASPAQASSITEELTEVVTSQLAELGKNIKLQAKLALENTTTELLFSAGAVLAEQSVTQTEAPLQADKKDTDDE
ncbi:hypothetical protein [Rheinheimera baltica]|uniref:Orphan protein n=1 Tax=Rheinheimera baltica TaxID=67576 RepID=A0ABT9I2P1_9GAMM|nr:hypothetical protein [Rheinheimera baltica]MDP5137221.1 hypothetical protein [Rheinheimera baltica]MDP5143230.1 hypothetical protein [Rheinheimera baltica]MDP5149969.1 hypothetical protein [Rheinheimera baltica]MDP5190080.1 hypothetical protein [Rheinheimera baltica]